MSSAGKTAWLNGLGIVGALLASLAGTAAVGSSPSVPPSSVAPASTAPSDLAPAHHIASASTVVDTLLLELCAHERIAAVTQLSADGPDAARFSGLHTIRSLDDLEQIVSLRPDVLVTHNVADPRRVARLRAAGLRVVDLGTLDGRASLGDDARAVGALCGAPEAGARFAAAFERRMDAVARDVDPSDRRSAIYLSSYGGQYLGGTTGSSYHDILQAAGLVDAAAARYRGWPTYSVEQLLELDPEVIVTRTGMRQTFCGHPVLSRLRACPEHVVEVPPERLDDPGPGMLEAAELVRAVVYP